MKVLRLIGEIGVNFSSGPAKQAFYLTKGLSEKGVEHVIVTYNAGEEVKEIKNVKIIKIKSILKNFHYKPSIEAIKEIINNEYDIIHAHGYRNFMSDLGLLAKIIKRKPFVITTHGTVLGYKFAYHSKSSIFQDLIYDAITQRITLRMADCLVASSLSEAEELLSLKLNNVEIIHHGLDLPEIERGERNKEEIRILIVSRLTKKNNIELAIEGFAKALEIERNLKLIIVGEEKPSKYSKEEFGYKKYLIKLVKKLGIEEKVEFKGEVKPPELYKLYSSSDIFLWTSRYDNFAFALLEAANFGLPIISTPVGISKEIIQNGKGGFLLEEKNPGSIAKAILALAKNTFLRKEMEKHNIIIAKKFRIEKMVNKYYRLYNKLIRKI